MRQIAQCPTVTGVRHQFAVKPSHDAFDGSRCEFLRRDCPQGAVGFSVVGKLFSPDSVGGRFFFSETINADVFYDVQESVNEVVNRLTFFKVGVLDVHHLVDAVAER